MAVGLAGAPVASHAQVNNLAPNPSFEEDEVIQDDPAWEKWCTWGYEGGLQGRCNIDETEAIDGARSLRIEPKGGTNWYYIVLDMPIPTQVNTAYTASFWVKAEAPRPLTAKWKATDNTVDWAQVDFQVTAEWVEYHMTAAAQSGETKLEFHCAAADTPFWLNFLNVYEGEYVAGIEPSQNANRGKAVRPAPADGAVDIPRDVVLSWTPGRDAQARNVYFGTDPVSVDTADTANPLGVLAGEGQAATTHAPAGLQYGQTYYWRVDEVGAPPESTILKGDMWQFVVESYAYPIENVTATGTATYASNTTINFGGAAAKFVKLTIEANWGGIAPQTGLAEVRFFYVPVQAFEPVPADDATGVSIDAEPAGRRGTSICPRSATSAASVR